MDALFGESGKALQLDFADERVSISSACNGIGEHYGMVVGHLEFSLLMHAMMACMDPTLRLRGTVIKTTLQGQPQPIATHGIGAPRNTVVFAIG